MNVVWTEPATADLDAIHDHIFVNSPLNAVRFVEALLAAVDPLGDFPAIGRAVPEAGRSDIRELAHQRYRIVYRMEPDRVAILAVIHGSRDLARLSPKPWERP